MGETDIDAINRCINRELGPKFNVSTARFSHHYNNPEGCSGEKPAIGRQRHTVGLVYLVQLDDTIPETIDRKWTSAIPPDLLSGHRIMAAKALGFQSTSKSLFS
jgi:hypothetical protein